MKKHGNDDNGDDVAAAVKMEVKGWAVAMVFKLNMEDWRRNKLKKKIIINAKYVNISMMWYGMIDKKKKNW